MGGRVQHRVLRVHQAVVPQPPLPVIGHAELLVPVDGGGHRPGEGGVEAQAASPHIPEQRGDGQGNGETITAVQLQKIFKDRPAGPGLQIDGSKQGRASSQAKWGPRPQHTISPAPCQNGKSVRK